MKSLSLTETRPNLSHTIDTLDSMEQTNTATQTATQTAPLTNSHVPIEDDNSVDAFARAEGALRASGIGFMVIRLAHGCLTTATAA